MKLVGDGKKGVLPFALGQASISLSVVVIGQLTYALTSSAGMAAGTVGILLMCSKVLDGITDLIAGFIIDKANFKLGKARPFDLMSVPLWILVVLCFSVPNLSVMGKIIWVLLTFNLCQSVSYTFCSVAAPVRAKRSFEKSKRAKALAMGGIMSAVLATGTSIMLPVLIQTFENKPFGWTVISSCFAIPGIIMSLLMFFKVPEMDVEEDEEEKGRKKELSFGKATGYFFKNRYALVLLVMIMMSSLANVICGTAGTYYFKYYMGNLGLASLVSLVSILGYVFLVLIPVLERKFSHKQLLLLAFVLMAAGGFFKYVDGKNLPILIVCGLLFTIGVTTVMTIKSLALIDCMAYGKQKFGVESEGVYSSINGFADKIASGLGAFLIGVILEMGHWDASLAAQPKSALTAIQFINGGLPAILAVVGIIATCFFNVEKEIAIGQEKHGGA